MEVLIESPCQHVTWTVQNFFQMPSEIDYSLDSPEFPFEDDNYCLRLFPNVDRNGDTTDTDLQLVRLTSTVPEKNVLYKLGYKWGDKDGHKTDRYDYPGTSFKERRHSLKRSYIEENTDEIVPDGTFTVLCYMRLEEQSRALSPQSEEATTSVGEEQQEELPGESVFCSSCWKTSQMELSIESPCQYVTWKIPDFFQLPSEIGYSLESPEFRFANEMYSLRLYPNGDTTYTDLQLVRLTSTVSEKNVSCQFGYKWGKGEGEEIDIYVYSDTTLKDLGCSYLGFPFSRSYIEEERDTYVPDGTLTVLCSMRLGEQSIAGSPKSKEAATSEALQKQEGLPGMVKLQSDYRRLLQKGTESDASVVVSGKEFRAHRCVLRARSTIFDSIFDHEPADEESGRVVIDDLEPENFGDFLEYLYTGGVEAGLSDDNAFRLYKAADKYDVPTLKSECVDHMHRNLSVDSFCYAITLALQYQEEGLLKPAVLFFKENMASIIVTAKWQQYVADNGTSANELLIKAVVPEEQ